MTSGMSDKEIMRLIRLLSALNAILWCNKIAPPDNILDELHALLGVLEKEILR